MIKIRNIMVILTMQATRQHILEILREMGQATVDEIVAALEKRRGNVITAVTVRHHLGELLKENLISLSQLRHRNTPGRPQQVYILTETAQDYFPDNYQPILQQVLKQLSNTFSETQINVLFDGVVENMISEANVPNVPLSERLNCVISYLNDHGYSAHCEKIDNGYLLYTTNCPYHKIAQGNQTLCEMDMKLVSALLGVVPRLGSRISNGHSSCSYFIPEIS